MSGIRLAIPSKGRLKEQTEEFFLDAGLRIEQIGGERGYTARMAGAPDIDVRLMSASEIASAVLTGEVHVGVTGEDLLRESAAVFDGVVHLLAPLGFGRARLVVAAPRSWIDVETMADLDDVAARHEARTGQRMRVATKYVNSTRRFFAAAGVGHYRIVESAGATEGAPAAGSAELIVDITTTGATLEGNGLKIIRDGLILSSEAQLAASLRADWNADARAALRLLLDVVQARREGARTVGLAFDARFDIRARDAALLKGVELTGAGELICETGRAHEVARSIAAAGGGPVSRRNVDFVYRRENPIFDAFDALLG